MASKPGGLKRLAGKVTVTLFSLSHGPNDRRSELGAVSRDGLSQALGIHGTREDSASGHKVGTVHRNLKVVRYRGTGTGSADHCRRENAILSN